MISSRTLLLLSEDAMLEDLSCDTDSLQFEDELLEPLFVEAIVEFEDQGSLPTLVLLELQSNKSD